MKPSITRTGDRETNFARVNTWRCRIMLAAIVVFALSLQAQSAPAPAALVVNVSGSVTPAVTPFSELTAGTQLNLGADGKLIFDDYYSCTEVTVTGGRVDLAAKGYKTSAGAKTSEERVPCKQEVVLKAGGEALTQLMRGGEPSSQVPRLSVRPSFVLVGARSQSFAAANITQKNAPIGTVKLIGPRFDWPADLQPLTVGVHYEITFVPKSPAEPSSTMRFVAVAAPKALRTSPPVVIRVD